jgi:hypothetical protein
MKLVFPASESIGSSHSSDPFTNYTDQQEDVLNARVVGSVDMNKGNFLLKTEYKRLHLILQD